MWPRSYRDISFDLGLTSGGGSGEAVAGGVGAPRVGLAHVRSQAAWRTVPCSQLGSVVGGPAARDDENSEHG